MSEVQNVPVSDTFFQERKPKGPLPGSSHKITQLLLPEPDSENRERKIIAQPHSLVEERKITAQPHSLVEEPPGSATHIDRMTHHNQDGFVQS